MTKLLFKSNFTSLKQFFDLGKMMIFDGLTIFKTSQLLMHMIFS